MARCSPSLEEIREMVAKQKTDAPASPKNLVPVLQEVMADMETPVSAYLKLSRGGTPSFLFESVEGGEHLARYSFIGFSPRSVVKTGQTKATSKDPLMDVEKQLQGLRSFIIKGQPPFTGGAVGYVTYDCVKYFEPRTASKCQEQKDALHIPESIFMY
jgi:anthranilate synthase component 1